MASKKPSTARKPAPKKPVATTSKKPAAAGAAKKPAPAKKKSAGPRAPSRRPSPAEELSKRIVAAMDDEFNIDLGKFYTEDAVSEEPAGGTYSGLQSLRSKLAGWLAGLRSAHWKARNVFFTPKSICIEWEADIVMKDGRQVKLTEVAVHELRGDKIAAERFYYDPRALMPPAAAPVTREPPRPRPAPKPRVRHSAVEDEEDEDTESDSDVDPMDL
jgi:hypothetical protein